MDYIKDTLRLCSEYRATWQRRRWAKSFLNDERPDRIDTEGRSLVPLLVARMWPIRLTGKPILELEF